MVTQHNLNLINLTLLTLVMPSILIEDLTEDQKQQLDIEKAKGNFDTWKQMFLENAGVDQ